MSVFGKSEELATGEEPPNLLISSNGDKSCERGVSILGKNKWPSQYNSSHTDNSTVGSDDGIHSQIEQLDQSMPSNTDTQALELGHKMLSKKKFLHQFMVSNRTDKLTDECDDGTCIRNDPSQSVSSSVDTSTKTVECGKNMLSKEKAVHQFASGHSDNQVPALECNDEMCGESEQLNRALPSTMMDSQMPEYGDIMLSKMKQLHQFIANHINNRIVECNDEICSESEELDQCISSNVIDTQTPECGGDKLLGDKEQQNQFISSHTDRISECSDEILCSQSEQLKESVPSNVDSEDGEIDDRTADQQRSVNQCISSKLGDLNKPYVCVECGKMFREKSNLGQHLLTHTGERKFECSYCGKKFSTKRNRNRHVLTHTGEKNFKCEICENTFTQKISLTKHMLIHTGEKKFKCDECGKSFSQKYYLTQHALVHANDKKFKCEECGKLFFRKKHLNQHLVIHSDDKKFKCSECGKLFTSKSNLKQHFFIHTGEKNFECVFCKIKFRAKVHLVRHIYIHLGEKKFKCDECGKSFIQKCHLTQHALIHTSDEKYKCDVCGKIYSQKRNLNRHHLLNHTAEKNENVVEVESESGPVVNEESEHVPVVDEEESVQ